MAQSEFVEVAKVNEIPLGKMKYVELNGKEIMIANIDGKFYALNDRCSHMNASLSMGNVKDNILTCPFHGARFDVTSGGKVSEPILTPSQEMEPLPKTWQKYLEQLVNLCPISKHTIRRDMRLELKKTVLK